MIFTVRLGLCEAEAKQREAFKRGCNDEVFYASPLSRVLCIKFVNKTSNTVFAPLIVTSTASLSLLLTYWYT